MDSLLAFINVANESLGQPYAKMLHGPENYGKIGRRYCNILKVVQIDGSCLNYIVVVASIIYLLLFSDFCKKSLFPIIACNIISN